MERPSTIKLDQKKYDEISARLKDKKLLPEDYELLGGLLKAMLWMTTQLELGRLGMARLRQLIFGKKTESRNNLFPEKKAKDDGGDAAKPGGPEKPKPPPPPKPGHGRMGWEEYTGAEKVFCAHAKLKAGDLCPECGEGRLHESVEPGHFVRFTGQAPITATVYETQKLRCGLCGKVFEAKLPEGTPPYRWDETAKAMAALLRYGYGVPHYRQEKLQRDLGMPISDSVLQELSEQVADCGHAVHRLLYQLSAQGTQLNLDDTTCRILELIAENKEKKPERVGIFTTALISKIDEYEIALFTSGRNHMGENIEVLLKQRAADLPPPRLMTDGTNVLPKNLNAVLANCLTHGRRQFVDIKENFPTEVQYVIDRLGEIYHFDAMALEAAMSDDARRQFHLTHSKPVIETLKAWCHDQIASKKCEPNSGLGKAIKYLDKRWNELTLFLRVPGAPLSNDIVERLIKRCVLHRKNSLFYKTQHGAVIGDILMTLIHTTVRAGENPFDYLTALQKHRSLVVKNPHDWLPWNYRNSQAAIATPQ